SGATLVYGILAQARPGTFKGGISLGFCPDMDLPKMLCQINGLKVTRDPSGKKSFLQPDARLGNPWIVLNGKLDRICNYTEMVDFIGKTKDAELISLPNVGHGFAKWSDFMPQWVDAYNRILKKYQESAIIKTDDSELKTLPLVITPARVKKDDAPAAFFISGDGGWYWFEQSIADSLAKIGIPTIGLDSKKYLWKRRSPEEAAGDAAAALTYYCNLWNKDRIIFIGYSLGAEILPFIVNRLPGELRSEVTSAVLLSPGQFTDFEIHISNMLGLGNAHNTYNVTAEINKMTTGNILCIFGKDEDTKLPEGLTNPAVKVRMVPGDHHYGNNLALIVRTMRENKVAIGSVRSPVYRFQAFLGSRRVAQSFR
ncbi:MAG: AcvB/VirJ family lysyl-phosphatidylglycerol hydrolase, partial [Bacteroidales bacterium]